MRVKDILNRIDDLLEDLENEDQIEILTDLKEWIIEDLP